MPKRLLLILLLLVATTPIAATAQDATVLTVRVPEFIQNNLEDDVFADFTAQTGIDVVFARDTGEEFFGGAPSAEDPDPFFEAANDYAASADVLLVQSFNMTPYITRAGYLLDMAPLIASDTTLDQSDFLPGMLDAFAWDGGTWAIPVSGSLNFWVYDTVAFDTAGVPYPDPSWTIDDFDVAVRTLAEVDDATGDVVKPGYFGFNEAALLRAFIGQPLYDEAVIPYEPDITDPNLMPLLETWSALKAEGYVGSFSPDAEFDPNDVPFQFGNQFNLFQAETEDQLNLALLPGGQSFAQLGGFAISSGTRYPQESYELVKYLSSNPDVATGFFGDLVVRRSVQDTDSDMSFFLDRLGLSPENEAVYEQAQEAIILPSDMLFADKLTLAVDRVNSDEVTVGLDAVLQEVQAETVASLQLASDRTMGSQMVVATPVPTPVLQAGEVSLSFGFSSFSAQLENREAWDALIEEFVANDPQVGNIEFETGFASIDERAEQTDCFYTPINQLQNEQTNLALLLSLDPFTSADPNFERDDFLAGVLDTVSRDGRLYAMPIILQPTVLRYNTEAFANAGLFEPTVGWSINEFENALRSLKTSPDDAPFQPQGFGNTYLLLLMAAYDAVPLDLSQEPPVVDFTSESSLQAMQRVLDLAKEGYIDYEELVQGGNFFFGGGSRVEMPALESLSLNGLNFGGPAPDEEQEALTRLTSYPVGTTYTPVAFDVGVAHISANTQHPEACYRWISTVTQHPELFTAIPARRSMLDSPAYQEVTEADEIAFYREFADLMANPNVRTFSSGFGGGSPATFVYTIFLNQAFDAYVLEDADLNTVMQEAQDKVNTYRDCIAPLPEPVFRADMSQEEAVAQFRPFAECAVTVDPSLEAQFRFVLAGDDE